MFCIVGLRNLVKYFIVMLALLIGLSACSSDVGNTAKDYTYESNEAGGEEMDRNDSNSKAASLGERSVGIGYSPWFPPQKWLNVWSEPELGFYDSSDTKVIRQHAEWLVDAGVDFIWIDWSNNVQCDPTIPEESRRKDLLAIEKATDVIFDEYANMERHPKISIFLGFPDDASALDDGRFQKKVDQIFKDYVNNPRFSSMIQYYLDKPLLVIYVGTPSPFVSGVPEWDDKRFTVRWMTGFLTQQPNLLGEDNISKYGYWSWWDRKDQTYSLYRGAAENMIVSAAYPGDKGWDDPDYVGRKDGSTFREQWERAHKINPKFVLINSWNEWVRNEELDPERSNDLEPSEAHGHKYLELLKEEIAKFKKSK